MFNYGNANEAQKEAISATDGLVLITAGPGTGKTFTLVKRAVYLIQECGIKPEQIMMATFTEKAAKELITRITNELAERNVSVNVNEMYIGTFHSLCLRIIKENLEFTRLKRNYRLLDTFDQKYLVFRNFHKFKNIEGIDELLSKGGSWKRSDEICTYINHLSEEMVDIEALQSDDNPGIRTLGRVLSVYQEMLEEGNLIDFSTIQTECYKLLMQNKQILEELQDKLQYLMIDEYQDTNYIQEQIVFLLGAKHHNICVVGDDDQGLYRFRGATIRNILEFPHKFENEGCKIIPLVVNYRSNSDIVDFYNEWISTTSGHKFKFSWDIYRYQKKIEPHVKSDIQSPAVVKLFSKGNPNEEGGEYKTAIGVLYAVAYTLKMSYKTDYKIEGFFEYVVPPLEGFWWQDNVESIDYTDKSAFNWISVIRLPDFITKKDFDWAVETASKKKKMDCSGAEFLSIDEGLCVQIMHIGAFDDEPATVAMMDKYLEENGYVNDFTDERRHHEIYLSDPRKVAPEKCKTVIRHPIKKA